MKSLLTFLSLIMFIGLSSQEICDNGIDDDFDGLIDMNDSLECACTQSAGGGGSIPSIIPNPSFESYSCCPTSWSQLNCADTWQQATTATSDYFNTCGHVHGDQPPGPLPDGNGYVGIIVSTGWMEYVGACLTTPMLAGQSYTLEFDIAAGTENGGNGSCGPIFFGDLDITIWGTDNCANLPAATTGCPTSGGTWSALAATTYTPVNSWGTISFTFTPSTDIDAIMIGAPCTLPASFSGGCGNAYYFFDDLTLNQSSLFGASVDVAGGFCTNDLELTGHPDTITGQYQWYVDGVALVGETDTILDVSGGSYPPGLYTFVTDIPGVGCVYANIDLPPVTYPDIDIVDPGPQCDPGPFDLNTLVVNDLNAVGGTATTYHSAIPANGSDMTNQLGSLNMMSTDVVYVMIADPVTGCFDVEQVILTWVTVSSTEAFTNETCPGDNDGTITLSGSGGTSPYTYDIGFGPTNTTGLFTNLPPNTYNYTVTDANGCQATGTITVNPGISCCTMTNTSASTDPICPGSCDGTITLTASAAVPPVAFSIDGGTNTDAVGVYTGLCAGTYDVLITDGMGCQYIESIVLTDPPPPVANFDFGPQPTTYLDGEIFFIDLSTDAAQWDWDFAGLGNSSTQNPTFEFDSVGNYNVTLIITSADGCMDTVMYTVVINDEFFIYVPNAVTINGDGYNDLFLPVLTGAVDEDSYTLYIFNRWGELIFESNNPGIGWDGNYKGTIVQEDVYVWRILVKDDQKNSYEYIGHVTVLK